MIWYGGSLAAGIAGSVWSVRLLWRTMLASTDGHFDWGDAGFACFFSLYAIALWPLLAIGMIVRRCVGGRDATEFARRVAGQSRADKAAVRAHTLAAREARIRQLERELGIAEAAKSEVPLP